MSTTSTGADCSAPGPAVPQPGHIRVTARAIRSVVAAIAAERLRTSPGRIGVQLHDRAGALGIFVQAPIAVPALESTASRNARGGVHPGGHTVLDRAEAARRAIGEEVSAITGSVTGSVDLRLTAATLAELERVR